MTLSKLSRSSRSSSFIYLQKPNRETKRRTGLSTMNKSHNALLFLGGGRNLKTWSASDHHAHDHQPTFSLLVVLLQLLVDRLPPTATNKSEALITRVLTSGTKINTATGEHRGVLYLVQQQRRGERSQTDAVHLGAARAGFLWHRQQTDCQHKLEPAGSIRPPVRPSSKQNCFVLRKVVLTYWL